MEKTARIEEHPKEYESTEAIQLSPAVREARPVRLQLISEEAAREFYPDGVMPPVQTAFNHYISRLFLWDTELIVEVMAKLGSKKIIDWAAYSLVKLTDGQRPDGFISNMQYLDKRRGFHIWKIEKSTFKDMNGSDYTQPAFLPTAVKAVVEAYQRVGDQEGLKRFLDTMHPRVKLHIEYFMKHRASSHDNPLAFNIHPHEDGRDSSGAHKRKLPRLKEVNPLGRVVDYADVALDGIGTFLSKNVRLRLAGWDLDKARKIYGRRDVMFNVVLCKNSYILSDLCGLMAEQDPDNAAKHEAEAKTFKEYAEQLEQAIYDHTWVPDAVWSPETRTHKGAFYSLKGNGEHEKNIDVGDLMTVLLPNLGADQLVSNLNLILTSFNTENGLPSAPKDSNYYDPRRKRPTGCNWSGSTWPHINKMIADGLREQAQRIETDPKLRDQFPSEMEADQTKYLCNLVADRLVGIAKGLTQDVYAEQYNPVTGEPQRYPHVKDFGMAMQADIIKYFGLDKNQSYFKLCQKIGRVVNIISF
jgi:hypothetical protein